MLSANITKSYLSGLCNYLIIPCCALILIQFFTLPVNAIEDENLTSSAITSDPLTNDLEKLTINKVQNWLRQVQDTSNVDEETKKNLVEQYDKAFAKLTTGKEWENKAKELELLIESAPQRLKEIKNKLSPRKAAPDNKIQQYASLDELEQLLIKVETDLSEARKRLAEIEVEPKLRMDNKTEIPKLIAESNDRLDEINQSLIKIETTEEPYDPVFANQVVLKAEKKLTEQKIRTYQKQLASYDATKELLTVQRDLEARNVSDLEKLAQTLKNKVDEQRLMKLEKDKREADQIIRLIKPEIIKNPVIARLVNDNSELVKERSGDNGLAEKIASAKSMAQRTSEILANLEKDFKNTVGKVEAIGQTKTVGYLLRNKLTDLPRTRVHTQNIHARQPEIEKAQIRYIQLSEERAILADKMENEASKLFLEIPQTESAENREEYRSAIKILLSNKLELQQALLRNYDNYLTTLIALDAKERQLVKQTSEYADYIEERILWIPSTEPLNKKILDDSWQSILFLTDSSEWYKGISSLIKYLRKQFAFVSLAFLILLLSLFFKNRLEQRFIEVGKQAEEDNVTTFRPTFESMGYSFILAAFFPFIVWIIGWSLTLPSSISQISSSAGTGLQAMAFSFFFIELVLRLCRSKGLADSHFKWSRSTLIILRRNFHLLAAVTLPMVFIVATLFSYGNQIFIESLGRIALITILLTLAFVFHRIFRPLDGMFQERFSRHTSSWSSKFRRIWHPLIVTIPISFAIFSAFGYTYTAIQLTGKLKYNLWLVLVSMFLYEIFYRWLVISQRKRSATQSQKIKDELQKDGDPRSEFTSSKPESGSIDPEVEIRKKLRRFFVIGLGFSLLLINVFPALGVLNQIDLWNVTSNGVTNSITLASILLAITTFLLMIWGARNFPSILDVTVLQRLSLETSVRFAISTITKYLVILTGTIASLGMVGINWSKLQWLVAGISVGLGFGLQEIFANFVSGLIILFERPIRVGDIVTVADVSGNITKINIRATTITDWDQREYIIPNKEFITQKFLNWTLSNPVTRVMVPVGIAYGSDTALAEKLLLEAAGESSHVMKDPRPRAIFWGFGDSALDFRLYVHIPNRDNYFDMLHSLTSSIDQKFRDAGISIAFPQRDVHFDSVGPLDIRIVSDKNSNNIED